MRIARTTVQSIYAEARKNWQTRWLTANCCALKAGIMNFAMATAHAAAWVRATDGAAVAAADGARS